MRKHAGESDTTRRRSGSKDPTAPRVNPTPCVIEAREAAATGRFGTEAVVPVGDSERQSPGFVSVKAPPAEPQIMRTGAGGQHPGCRKVPPR